ncbi:MAG: hypothetical protein U1E69_03160 [Tabrizicola sp.]|uniref:hypothetical protein n=1 Tax=Tabrizicola sp. TaxID=2005166 RepID=UPI002ABA338D|nr:hypothetical protein [Tabrizicola sp.]MDZ4085781.1 hypothetical protein [Tabrizicola sp.]
MYEKSGSDMVFNTHPDEADCSFVEIVDLPAFLDVHRDQSLWLACISGLNPDGDIAAIAAFHKWMVSQPDCDNVVASAVWGWWGGHRSCGLPSTYGGPIDEGLVVAKFTAERARNRPFSTGALSDPWPPGTRADLLAKAQAEAKKLGPTTEPMAPIPEEMLRYVPVGGTPREGYAVEETGLLVLRIPSNKWVASVRRLFVR